MTAYGLLTYTILGDVASALPVVKWLSQQRNALGGFSSTQVFYSLLFSACKNINILSRNLIFFISSVGNNAKIPADMV